MKAKITIMILVLVLYMFTPTVVASASVSISQAGADPNTVMKGIPFTITVSGLSGSGTVTIINQTWFSMGESNTKAFSSSSVSWTTVVANQRVSAQTISATITVAGSPESATSNSFDVILPPSIITSVNPASISNPASGSTHSVQLNIQNYGETIAKDVVVSINLPTGILLSSGSETQTISTIEGGAGGSGESVGRSWTLLVGGNVENSTITITISPSYIDSKTETINVTAPSAQGGTSTPTPTPTTSSGPGGGGGGGGAPPTSGNLPTDEMGRVTTTTTISSSNGLANLIINEGTIALDVDENPLKMVSISSTSLGGTIAAYNHGPDGASFNPEIDSVIAYDPNDVPEGKTVVLKMFDGTKWIPLETNVDTQTNTAEADISHFTYFALFVENKKSTTSEPTITPAPTSTSVTDVTPETPTEETSSKVMENLPILIGIIVVVVLIAVVMYFKRR